MAEINVRPGADGGVYGVAANPGDTIILDASDKFTYFYGGGAKGTPDNPIIIRNRGGVVHLKAGFDVNDMESVKILGDGDSNTEYGFYVDSELPKGGNRENDVLSVAGLAKDIEMTRVWGNNSQCGVWIKNELGCDDQLNEHIISDIFVHGCKFTDIQVEGIYAGTTNFLKGGVNVRPIYCNGQLKIVVPPFYKNFRINDNIFDGTGRAGIQLSYAHDGVNEILRNRISNVGTALDQNQGNGINIGTFTNVRVADNIIRNTLVHGICSFGIDTVIENNDIDGAGFLNDQLMKIWALGIQLDTRETNPFTQARATVRGNKIGKRGSGAATDNGWKDIGWYDQFGHQSNQMGWNDQNIIQGNLSTITGKEAILDIDPKIQFLAVPVPMPAVRQLLFSGQFFTEAPFKVNVYSNGDVEKA